MRETVIPFVLLLLCLPAAAADQSPNVLFIAIDDLRFPHGSEVIPQVRTPALDALAAQGRMFSRHYVHVPTCGASRCALLRGRRPDRAEHLRNDAILQTHRDWATESLPGIFRAAGYQTFALGKITHYPGGRTGKQWAEGPEELPDVWTRCWIPDSPWGSPQAMMHAFANGVPRSRGKSPPTEAFDGPDSAYPDAWVADEAIAQLDKLEGAADPWLLSVGFFKPHLPFASPKRWLDSYSEAAFPQPAASRKPNGISSWHGSGEFRGNYGHNGRDPDGDPKYARALRQAYAAAISYMDAQLGRLIAALHRKEMADNTIIVVWSDHGFLLGEHAIWGKHCLYEEALRSPLIFVAPQINAPGVIANDIVETVDVLPTLAELCGIAAPDSLDGSSLLPHLKNPEYRRQKPAVSSWGQQRTIRTSQWRLIAHSDKSGKVVAHELFDYNRDPFETTDVAAQHPEVVTELLTQLDTFPQPRRIQNRQ